MQTRPSPTHRITVLPCDEAQGCYRWIIRTPDGRRAERSSYAFATVAGARASAESWRREFEAGQDLKHAPA